MRSKTHGDRSRTRRSPELRCSSASRPQRRNFLLALGVGGAGAAIVAARYASRGSVRSRRDRPSPDGKGYQ